MPFPLHIKMCCSLLSLFIVKALIYRYYKSIHHILELLDYVLGRCIRHNIFCTEDKENKNKQLMKKEFCGQCHVSHITLMGKVKKTHVSVPPLERWPVASSSLRVIILYLFVCSSPPPPHPCPSS